MLVRRFISLCLLLLTVAALADQGWHVVDARASHDVQTSSTDDTNSGAPRLPGSHAYCPGHSPLAPPSGSTQQLAIAPVQTDAEVAPVVVHTPRVRNSYRAHLQPYPQGPPLQLA